MMADAVAGEPPQAQARERERAQPLKKLLRTLCQPDQHENLQTQLSELLSDGSLTAIHAYELLMDQALRFLPRSSSPYPPDRSAEAGFGGPSSSTIQYDGAVAVEPRPHTLSVHDALFRTLTEGICPPVVPPISEVWATLDEDDNDKVERILSDYIFLFAAYRRPDGIRQVLQILDENSNIQDAIDYQSNQNGTPLRVAARMGASQCVELLLARDADPNRGFVPPYQQVSQSILQAVLWILQHQTVPNAPAEGDEVEAVDFPGVLDALLSNGAVVNVSEVQAAMMVADVSVLQRILQAGLQQETLSQQDLIQLAPASIAMDAKPAADSAVSRLSLLLQKGVDPNLSLEELSVPWQDGTTKATRLMEIAIQTNNVASFQALKQAGGSLTEALDRVLCTTLTEEMLVALEEALEEEELSDDNTFLRPPTFEIQSGYAWVGNAKDFESYLRKKKQPPKMRKLDPQWEAILKAREAQQPTNYKFPDIPAQNGTWIGLAPLPNLQLVFHVDCPNDYLIGAVVGAMHGGFTQREWNPLHPPPTDLMFTGRMAYSEDDPRHVTWFLDAMAVEATEPTAEETEVLEALREAAVPDGDVLQRLRSLALVGVWKNQKHTQSESHSSALMWTCQQEYRYGIMAGKKVFISIGYEAMDLKNEAVALVLDAVIRAKQHHHRQPTRKQKPFFARTQFSTTHLDYLDKVPKKRTPTDIFEYELEQGNKYVGLDPPYWTTPLPPKDDLKRFAPEHRIYDAQLINAMLQHKFNCTMAKQLEEDTTLLIDELIMMFLRAEMVPGLMEALKEKEAASRVDAFSKKVAELVFPDHTAKNPLQLQCYQRLVPPSTPPATTPGDSGINEEQVAALRDRIGSFLVSHLASSGNHHSKEPILKDQNFLNRVFDVCQYLILETLELSNNNRRDALLPSVVPRHIRWSISSDRELTEVFHSNEAMEFFYPASSAKQREATVSDQ